MTAPTPLTGVTEETALPYRLWQVLDLVDGVQTLPEIARRSGLNVAEVEARLAEVPGWLGRAAKQEAPATGDAVDAVTQCLTKVVGPMAEVMVDDTLDDLGDGATLSALLGSLMAELSPAQVAPFARLLRERGLV